MAAEKLGYIGLGTMGMPMALNFLKAGYDLTVWGRTPSKLQPAVDAGATLVTSPKEVADAADIVFTCVYDTDAVEEVVFAENGIVAGGTADKILVDMSTIHPLKTREFAGRLANACSMKWIDAPVSGGGKGAQEGTLVIMAGGDEPDIKRVETVVPAVSRRLTHMGPVGAGQATKLINQIIIAAEVAVIAEGFNFAQNFGVSASKLPDCLAGGWADSSVLQDHGRRMAAAKYAVGGPINMLKDINIATDMGKNTGSPMPITSMVAELYRLVAHQGHADKGQIALMALYRDEPLD